MLKIKYISILFCCLLHSVFAQDYTIGSDLGTAVDGLSYGQSFRANVLGPAGSATVPAVETVYLKTFAFSHKSFTGAFIDVSDRTLYIYASLPAEDDIGKDTNLVGASQSVEDGVFIFDSLALNSSQQYYAVLDRSTWMETASGDPYPGGDSITSGNGLIILPPLDSVFSATFSTEPGTPLPTGLGWVYHAGGNWAYSVNDNAWFFFSAIGEGQLWQNDNGAWSLMSELIGWAYHTGGGWAYLADTNGRWLFLLSQGTENIIWYFNSETQEWKAVQ